MIVLAHEFGHWQKQKHHMGWLMNSMSTSRKARKNCAQVHGRRPYKMQPLQSVWKHTAAYQRELGIYHC